MPARGASNIHRPSLSLVPHPPISASREIEQLTLLTEASIRIHSTLDSRLIMRYLVNSAMELVGASKGGAGLLVDDCVEFTDGNIDGQWQELSLKFPSGSGVSGQTRKTLQPYISNEPLNDPNISAALYEKLGCYNAIAVPLLTADERYLGCFEIHNTVEQRDFDSRDISLLQYLAVYAAIALENARLYNEQRATAKRLEKTSKRYQQIFHSNMAAKLLIDPANGMIVDANHAALQLYGYSSLSNKAVSELEVEPSEFSQLNNASLRVLEGDEHIKAVHRCNDGSSKTVLIGISPLVVDTRDMLLAVVQDISGQIAVETALAESEQMTEAILENICEGVCCVDSQGKLIFTNPSMEQLLGYERGECIGANAFDFLHMEEAEQLCPGRIAINKIIDVAKGGKPIRYSEASVIAKDGRRIPVEFLCAPTRDHKRKINGCVLSFIDIRSRLRQEQYIRDMAYSDGLTGLPNRLALQEKLEILISDSQENNQYGALLFFDVDNFKTINDSLGHSVGDQMLQAIASRLNQYAGNDKLVARHGGDEFIIVLKALNSDQNETWRNARKLANKLQEQLSEPYKISGHMLHSGVSLGIAIFGGNDGLNTEDVIRHADTAMYAAKRQGRAQICEFRPEMQQAVVSRLVLEGELRLALSYGEIKAHYQPKVGMNSRNICGAEALIRWEHPKRGIIMPNDFIPTAEESGLITDLGNAVFDNVFRQLCEWRKAGLKPVPIAVNLSASQFNQPHLAKQLAEKLRDYDLPGSLLELEITETTLMNRPERVRMNMLALRQIGVRISVDDFGTGYSSLHYLKKFPLDAIKIDREFIKDILLDPDDRAITSAIVSMAKALQLKTVAEGVETEDQLNYLHELGCDQFQGWLHSKAMPGDELSERLETTKN